MDPNSEVSIEESRAFLKHFITHLDQEIFDPN